MATRGANRSVLLVVDVQAGVVEKAYQRDETVGHIGTMVEKARGAGVPVVWVQHSDDELVFETPEWQLAPGLVPRSDEARLDKHFNSCFEQTTLPELLDAMGASRIVLVGAATNWCIRATAYGALERGYDVSLIADAHTTGALHAKEIIEDLNITMKWVGYPGRTNESKSTQEFEF